MRVYNATTGKFEEREDQVQSTPESVVSSSGDDGSMRKLFAMMMLKNPKQASTLKSVHDMLNPEKTEAEKKREAETVESGKALKDAYYNIGKARKEFNESGSGIQYQDALGIRSKLPTWLFGFGEDAAQTKTSFAETNKRLFETAGKAFTGSERALLEGLILDIAKNKEANTATLNDAESLLLKRMRELGVTPEGYTSQGGQGGWQ